MFSSQISDLSSCIGPTGCSLSRHSCCLSALQQEHKLTYWDLVEESETLQDPSSLANISRRFLAPSIQKTILHNRKKSSSSRLLLDSGIPQSLLRPHPARLLANSFHRQTDSRDPQEEMLLQPIRRGKCNQQLYTIQKRLLRKRWAKQLSHSEHT